MKSLGHRATRLRGLLFVLLGCAGMPAFAQAHPLAPAGLDCGGFVFPYTLAGSDNAARVAELRLAIECANANAVEDVIDLDGHALTFTDGPYPSSVGDNALPAVTSGIVLQNGRLLRDAAATTPFRFLAVESNGNLSVLDMGLAGGNTPLGGGAIAAFGPLTLRRTLFENNASTSSVGGAVSAHHLTVLESRFTNNRAPVGAAAIWTGRQAPSGTEPVTILNSRFESHGDASEPAGRVVTLATTGQIRLENLLFLRNTVYGGLIGVLKAATASNLTLVGNDLGTGGLLFGQLTVHNSIVWGNQVADPGAGAVFHHSLVQGGFAAGSGNIDLDPGFADAANDDYTLDDGSPAIDAGDSAIIGPDTHDLDGDADTTEDLPDLAGNPRRHNDATVIDTGAGAAPRVDMGAFERPIDSAPAGITITPTTGLVTGEDGTSDTFTVVLDRYPAADVAIALSSNNTGEGTVAPANLVFTPANWNAPQTVAVTGVDDAVVDGDVGYGITAAVTSTDPAYQGITPPDVPVTNVDDETGACGDFVFPYTLAGSDNAARVAELRLAIECANANAGDDEIDLGGHALTFGDAPYTDANGSNALPSVTSTLSLGNGALQRDTAASAFRFLDVATAGTLTVRAMQLRHGASSTEGGAIRADGQLVLKASVFEDNRAALRGGAVASHATTTIVTSRFERNAAVDGAAIAGGDADAIPGGDVTLVVNSRFEHNGDQDSRSVIWNKSYFAMVGSLMAGNQLPAAGSSLLAFHDDTAVAELRNVTLADNTVQGALFARPAANVQVRNSIVWDNAFSSLGNVSPVHSILPGVPAVNGNLDQPPGFAGVGDYRLASGSPAIDAADNAWGFPDGYDADEDGNTSEHLPDLDLNPRPLDDAGVADGGSGTSPILDIGAYEYQADSVAAGIDVTPTSGLVTGEGGTTANFTIVLERYPAADVSLALSSSDRSEGIVAPASLTFTQADWNLPRTVTITGVDDALVDGDQAYTIVIAPAGSADPAYDGIDPPDVGVINQDDEAATYDLGGTVVGLSGSGLALSLDGNEILPVATNGGFTFATMLAPGEDYVVAVASQPQDPPQACVVINGSGTMGTAAIDNIVVNCGASVTYAVGGTLDGLAGDGLVLQLNGSGDLALAADGDYAFVPRLVEGAGYVVTIRTQPQGQWCTLANASGSVQGADVTDVDVACAPLQAQLHLGVDDGREYARYGRVRDYFVTLGNSGNATATGVTLGASFSAAFDVANAQWQCVGSGGGASCGSGGSGGFSDSADIPPASSLTWIVSVPVLGGSNEPDATLTVGGSALADATDTDTLIIFRDGYDVPYADGTQSPGEPEPFELQGEQSLPIEWPASGEDGLGVVRVLATPGGRVVVQRLRWQGADFVRLLGSDARERERVSAWARVPAAAQLVVARVSGNGNEGIVLLEGAAAPLALPQLAGDHEGEIE